LAASVAARFAGFYSFRKLGYVVVTNFSSH
jgi:hypothetical protein